MRDRIAAGTNELIARGVATETVWITDEELDARPELVKTMSVQPPRGAGRIRLLRIPDIDLQPCGGTHVANIAEIGGIAGHAHPQRGQAQQARGDRAAGIGGVLSQAPSTCRRSFASAIIRANLG